YEQEFPINIVDVGQGIHQALPLVVRANVTDRPDSIIVLEQPELHLHPAAHGDLAELFAKSAKENNQTFLIETHSENIILRLRKLIVENDFGFTKDDLIIYWIEDAELKGKELREITVDEEGVLSDWPEGVFNEGMKEILEMQKALRRKEEQ
ncbi:MAG: AAA family ATPase, partial [Sphaerospermopsis kisseleviana]